MKETNKLLAEIREDRKRFDLDCRRIAVNVIAGFVAVACFLILIAENGPTMSLATLLMAKVIAVAVLYACLRILKRVNPHFFDELDKED